MCSKQFSLVEVSLQLFLFCFFLEILYASLENKFFFFFFFFVQKPDVVKADECTLCLSCPLV